MPSLLSKIPKDKRRFFSSLLNGYFWFICGVTFGLFFFISFLYIVHKNTYQSKIYPGVYVDGKDFGGKTKEQLEDYFQKKNEKIQQSLIIFTLGDKEATVSAKELEFGYNPTLLADQAYSIGRSSNMFSNFSLITQAYFSGIYLPATYQYQVEKLDELLKPLRDLVYAEPVDARFSFEDGRVKEFKTSSDGKDIDMEVLKLRFSEKTLSVIRAEKPLRLVIPVPVKILKPKVTTNEVNDIGITELVASGSSLFVGSIPNRIYNITLAATRLNGILIKPDEIFSFNKAIGDISTFTGYKQAYVIQNGRTVLGDGGGVCQVSTTLFRAALNAGLPIIERNPHAYRVSYYEQDQGPGLDASIYVPTNDFRFKNDTGHYLLIQTIVDPNTGSLTFELYGTKDNREVTISKPVITSVTSSPEPLYIDDPTMPKGEVKQIDYAVSGATVYFTREVKKDGQVILSDRFNSNYRAWQAVYLRGTKEG